MTWWLQKVLDRKDIQTIYLNLNLWQHISWSTSKEVGTKLICWCQLRSWSFLSDAFIIFVCKPSQHLNKTSLKLQTTPWFGTQCNCAFFFEKLEKKHPLQLNSLWCHPQNFWGGSWSTLTLTTIFSAWVGLGNNHQHPEEVPKNVPRKIKVNPYLFPSAMTFHWW